ncbi:hypothetical protein F5Y08DRAFT_338858 [Xylaria arbuscula]|nr:hypothetical protein F5Y08DRAFT_338858 [Xylaria arbuscula]
MAEALLAQGETVLRVIILDSGNPETFPAFKSEAEHKALTEATYNQIIAISTALHTDGRNSPDNTSSESRTSSESELNEDDESSLVDNIHLAKLIRRHISDAFLVLSNHGQRGFLSEKLDTHVVLIKCKTTLQIDNTALLNRSAYMLGLMRDKFMDWDTTKFRRFDRVDFSGDHYASFGDQHVEELSNIFASLLWEFN